MGDAGDASNDGCGSTEIEDLVDKDVLTKKDVPSPALGDDYEQRRDDAVEDLTDNAASTTSVPSPTLGPG